MTNPQPPTSTPLVNPPHQILKTSFTKIILGFILVVLNFEINRLIIFFPDFIGYVFISAGLNTLTPYSSHFTHTKELANFLVGFSLFLTMVVFISPIIVLFAMTPFTIYATHPFLLPIYTLYKFLNFVMIWFLCNGIFTFTRSQELPSLEYATILTQALNLVNFFVTEGFTYLLYYTLDFDFFVRTIGHTVTISILTLMVIILLLILTYNSLTQPPTPHAPPTST